MEKHLKLDKKYFIWNGEQETLEYLGVLTYVENLKDNWYALNFNQGSQIVKYYTKTSDWILRNMVDEEKAKSLLYYYNRELGDKYDDSYYELLLHHFFIDDFNGAGKSIIIKNNPGFISQNAYSYYLGPFYEINHAFVDEEPDYFDSLPDKIVINRPKETVALLYDGVDGGYNVYKSKRQKDDRNDFDVEIGFYIAFYKYCMTDFTNEFQKTIINKIYALRKTKRQILDFFKAYFENYLLELDMSANQIKRFQQTIKYFDMYEGKINETITIGGKDIIVEVI